MAKAGVKRNIFQRLLGICATRLPADTGCWNFADGKITVDLSRAPELTMENGAIRLEEKVFPIVCWCSREPMADSMHLEICVLMPKDALIRYPEQNMYNVAVLVSRCMIMRGRLSPVWRAVIFELTRL